MKLCYFDDWRTGIVTPAGVVDVSAVVADIPHTGPGDRMSGLIARWDAYKPKIEAATAAGKPIPLTQVKFRAPLPKPGNIACMAVNYMEDGTLPAPPAINAFHKAANAIIGPGDTMVLPDVPATIFEGEAEMALVIGKRATNVSQANAMSHVFGYINFIDGSARGLPPSGNVFFQMKSRDTFAPIGPYIVTADEIADPQNLPVRLWVNGVLKQNFNTNDMAHNIARCIEWVSAVHTLQAGDILATGTNHRGLHAYHDGDKIEIECEGMGRLSFNIRDELKRTWDKRSRLERQEAGLPAPAEQMTGKHAKKA
jgi:2-keto-4-pentenoate hydratase/2-oxohepta-3-ene-1,7-dioic acid hydratase in catechol pathway